MQLGLSSYAYGWAVAQGLDCFDEHTLLDRARGFGLSLVQFGDHIPLVQFDRARLQRLRSRAQDEGITLETGGRTLTPENLRAHIALCENMNSRLLRFVIDGEGFEPAPQEVVAIVRAQVSRLEGSGVTLGIENHDRLGVRVLSRIVEEVGSACVGVCLDTANSLGAGEGLQEVLQVLARDTVSLHLKDFCIRRVAWQMGFEIRGCAAGQGMMDAPSVVAHVALEGRCASAVVETWAPAQPGAPDALEVERQCARASVEYLRGLGIWSKPSA